MTAEIQIDDLGLAALISSRICHDIISPVGAISNGLEVLDEENDEEVRAYAWDLIRRSTEQASAKLQFARLAFGAAGSAGMEIDLATVRGVADGIVDESKHKIEWQLEPASLPKNQVKLLLNLFAIAITTLPRGGTIYVKVGNGPAAGLLMQFICQGQSARLPEHLHDLMSGQNGEPLNTLSVQPYYTNRIAMQSGMIIEAGMQDGNAILQARTAY